MGVMCISLTREQMSSALANVDYKKLKLKNKLTLILKLEISVNLNFLAALACFIISGLLNWTPCTSIFIF